MQKILFKSSLAFLVLAAFSVSTNVSAQQQSDFSHFNRFYDHVAQMVAEQKIDLAKDYKIHLKADVKNGTLNEGSMLLEASPGTRDFGDLAKEFLVAVDNSEVLTSIVNKTKNEKITAAEIEISPAKDDFYFKLDLTANSPNAASRAAAGLRFLFTIAVKTMEGRPEAEFYKNGAIESDKNAIMIATHISRDNLKRFLSR